MDYHIFNPGHEEALATNTPYYTDSKAAKTLAADLQALPAHWAKEGDCWTMPSVWDEVQRIVPWGWNSALVHRLRNAGAPDRLLPTEEVLAQWRQLSSRQTAVELLPKISSFRSLWCENMAAVEAGIKEWRKVYIKAPWSSSGRGILRTDGRFSNSEAGRVRRWLERQGAVVIEPLYRKKRDFALEFSVSQEGIVYEGLSVFTTEGAGAYAGNVVAAEDFLRTLLPDLSSTITEVTQVLEERLLGRYEGVLGVDMMWLESGEIHPCVEINFRRTMGWVALQLRKYLPAGQIGRYLLRPRSPLAAPHLCLTPEAQRVEAVLLFEQKDSILAHSK